MTLPIVVDGESESATVTYGNWGMSVAVGGVPAAGDAKVFETAGEAYVLRGGRQTRVRLKDFAAGAAAESAGDGVIKAPMHGKVLEILAQAGDRVTAGQRLAVIEAMKMEHTLRAPFDGAVTQVAVDAGAQVVEGGQIMVLEPDNKAIE
jgi:3-methylcrotonyl-CoA carboxylase alpha subunit